MGIESKVKRNIEWMLCLPKNTVKLEDTEESLSLDSLDKIEIIMQIEEDFNVEIRDHEAIRIKDVNDIVNIVTGKL